MKFNVTGEHPLWAIKKLPKTEEMTSEDREIWVQAMMVDPFLNYPVL